MPPDAQTAEGLRRLSSDHTPLALRRFAPPSLARGFRPLHRPWGGLIISPQILYGLAPSMGKSNIRPNPTASSRIIKVDSACHAIRFSTQQSARPWRCMPVVYIVTSTSSYRLLNLVGGLGHWSRPGTGLCAL